MRFSVCIGSPGVLAARPTREKKKEEEEEELLVIRTMEFITSEFM